MDRDKNPSNLKRLATEVLDMKRPSKKEKTVVQLPFPKIPALSSTTFSKYPGLVVERLLPFYIDDGNVLEKIRHWLFSDSKETQLCFLEDNPGLGKSTTPLAAAHFYKVGYVVVEPKVNVMKTIQEKIEDHLKTLFPDGGKEGDVIEAMEKVLTHAFTHLFKKCNELILENNSVLVYGSDLNNYDGISKYEDVQNEAFAAAKQLLETVANLSESKSNRFIVHFDEMQNWATEDFERNQERHVSKAEFSKYYLIALSEVMLAFKGRGLRFVISGTNIEQGRVLRIASQVKTLSLSLALFSEDSVLQLLDLFFNLEDLDREELRKKIARPLVGCVRSCEYFLGDVQIKLQNTSPEKVVVDDLEKSLEYAYERWASDVGNRSRIPGTLVDEVMLTYMFPQHVGGQADDRFPEAAILLPRANIPPTWLQFAENGLLRLQTVDDDLYRLWKPYYFLMRLMKAKTTVFEFSDVDELRAEIIAGSSSPGMRKGYCFQRAVALELVNPHTSALWQLIVSELRALGLIVTPIPLQSRKVSFFKKNSEIKQDWVCNAQDVKNKGEATTTKKKGDICGPRVIDADGVPWDIIIEAKNYTSPHNDKLKKFYERGYGKNMTATKEIFIYLCLNPMPDSTPAFQSRMKTNKVFLLINGLRKQDCTLDIHFLSTPGQHLSIGELKERLIPSITSNPSLLGVKETPTYIDVGGTERGSCNTCEEGECPQFVRGKDGTCSICGCLPARHENLSKKQ